MNEESGLKGRALTPSIITIVRFLLQIYYVNAFFLIYIQIKARGSQLRGEAKTKTASLVEALYGFDSGRSKRAITQNRKIAEGLKEDKGFVYEVIKLSLSGNDFFNSVSSCFQVKMGSEKGFTTTL